MTRVTLTQRKSPLTNNQRQVIATVVNLASFDIGSDDVWTIRICDLTGVVWVHLYDGRQLPFNHDQFKSQIEAVKNDARIEKANDVVVIAVKGSSFTVCNTANGNTYTVEPQRYFKNQRCNCGDCRRRGVKCKHQIAVANWLASLAELVTA